MTVFPVQYESDVVLRDGSTLRLRPVRSEDAADVLAFYKELSPESLYFRFMLIPALDDRGADWLAGSDDQGRFLLVGTLAGRIVAVAGYYRDRDRLDRAEVAFAIADRLQGRGIGTRLLERLGDIARERGIMTFDAHVLPENRQMMQVFLDSGFDVQQQIEGGAFHVTLSLAPTPAFEARAAARAQEAATASMRTFFEPRTVAIVGASRQKGKIGSAIFDNVRRCGFRGRIAPVNPHAAVIDDVPAYPTVSAIPGEVDLAVIAVPSEQVSRVVDDCLAKGVKGLVVITAGFSETDAEGRAREMALLEKVRAAGARLVGPNCLGILNTDPAVRLNATFSPIFPPAGTVALSTQSGALGLAVLAYANRLNLGISTFVSVGNKADVSGNDLIQYWIEDPRTAVILLYLESFGNPRKFSQIARRVGRRKPIVVVKAGRSTAGARAAMSHTGALALSDAVVEGLFRQAGVIRTNTLEELFDVAMFLAHQQAPKGPRVGILTNAGGPGILAADACEANGLVLPMLQVETTATLKSFLPPAASVANPVDMIASATPEHFRRAMHVMLADSGLDSLLVIFIPPLGTDPEAVASAIAEGSADSRGKSVAVVFMSGGDIPPALRDVPSYVFPESAAGALARVTRYGVWRERPLGTVPTLAGIHSDRARDIIAGALKRGSGWLTPAEAQGIVEAAGMPIASARLAATEDEAASAARTIGFPVALKAVGPTIVHKTEVGGIKLGLSTEGELRQAFRDFTARPGADLTGVLIQEMVRPGVEMLLGAVQDPTFGPVIACGSGGVLVDLLADVVFRLHPLTERDAAEMLEEMKGAKLLRGFRGAPPADEAALRDALLRLSALVELCPEVQEIDINPLIVLERGVRLVDVRVRVGRGPERPSSRRVLY